MTKIHGFKGQRIYNIWRGMRTRCNNKNRDRYARYGGRGITVCASWYSFLNFLNDMKDSYDDHVSKFGERNTTLDRKDNDKGYSKDNCKWSTYQEQVLNKTGNFPLKLSDEDIDAILLMLDAGNSQYKIAAQFNVTQSLISQIKTRKQRFKSL